MTLKLQILIFVLYAANACYFPFQPVYFSDRKLSFTEIGIAFAVGALIGLIIQPVWGYLTDKYLDKRKTLFITLIANSLIILFFIKADSFQGILALIILNGIFMSGIYPILDAYTFDVIEGSNGLNYSHFRFVASAAYAVTNLALGYIVKAYNINLTFIAFEIMSIAGIFVLLNMKFKGKRSVERISFSDIREALSSKKLVLFFITIFLMNIAIIGGVNYMNELIKHTKGDVSNLGMVWFTTCVFEVITFYFAGKLIRRIGVIRVYLISILVFALKFFLDSVFMTPFLIISVQLLDGFAFTLFITSSLEFLNLNTKSQVRASMMSLYAATGGFGSFIAGLFGGMILNMVNPSQLYGILAAVCVAALLCGLSLWESRIYCIVSKFK